MDKLGGIEGDEVAENGEKASDSHEGSQMHAFCRAYMATSGHGCI